MLTKKEFVEKVSNSPEARGLDYKDLSCLIAREMELLDPMPEWAKFDIDPIFCPRAYWDWVNE
jgi:hypothetical protein